MTQESDERKQAEELAQELFSKSFLVLLAHVQRRIAKDESYEEPRFLRAFLVAFTEANKPGLKSGENVAGLSVSDDNTEAYAVMIQKKDAGFEVLELRDLILDEVVGQREMMRLIQLSILLDNISTEKLEWKKAIEILENSVPGVRFVKFPNNQWKNYRVKLKEAIESGKYPQIPLSSPDLARMESATSFGDIPQFLRSTMGVIYAQHKYPKSGAMAITTPDKSVDKHRIFEMAKEMLYGRGAKYRKPTEE